MVGETGICLLSHKTPESECPNYQLVVQDEPDAALGATPSVTVSEQKTPIPLPADAARYFDTGLELGTDEVAEIGRARYYHMVGVLGTSNVGKTCFLLSLYLKVSNGVLPNGYVFAGSMTLKGFEDRARRLRDWNLENLPDQLAEHTHLSDYRQPALLHIAFCEKPQHMRRFDVMFTDLPGEWCKHLVDRSSAAGRFEFLRRADGIVLVVDGGALMSDTKYSEIERSKQLMERLIHSVGIDPSVPLEVLVAKCDTIEMRRPDLLDDLLEYGRHLGFSPRETLSASFSKSPSVVQSGVGVFEPVDRILKHDLAPVSDKRRESNLVSDGRIFMNFRGTGR